MSRLAQTVAAMEIAEMDAILGAYFKMAEPDPEWPPLDLEDAVAAWENLEGVWDLDEFLAPSYVAIQDAIYGGDVPPEMVAFKWAIENAEDWNIDHAKEGGTGWDALLAMTEDEDPTDNGESQLQRQIRAERPRGRDAVAVLSVSSVGRTKSASDVGRTKPQRTKAREIG